MASFTWYSTTEIKRWEIEELRLNSTEISVDTLELTGDRHQVIDGFGGCFNELGWIALSHVSEEVRNEILDELFLNETGCKFNFCRLPIGASDYASEWYSHNETENDFEMESFSIARDHKYLLPYIKEGVTRNPQMKLFASPWSPPTWMKFPKAYNYGKLIWDKKILKSYALYFLKFIEAYKIEGLNIDQIHIQNEPSADQKFPSCLWSGEEFREFIAEYIGPLFEKHGNPAEIWLGTINGPDNIYSDYDNYANLVLSDKKAKKHISGVSYQWNGKNAVQKTHESWPEIKLMQSENECGEGKNSWEYAHYVFGLFRHYLANGVNSYIYWNMVLEPTGRSTWGWNQNSMITINPNSAEVTYNPEFYVMKHFSHFIKPGAVRLGTKGHFTGNALAFENLDGTIVIIVNNSMKKDRKITIKANGLVQSVILKAGSFNTFVSSN